MKTGVLGSSQLGGRFGVDWYRAGFEVSVLPVQ